MPQITKNGTVYRPPSEEAYNIGSRYFYVSQGNSGIWVKDEEGTKSSEATLINSNEEPRPYNPLPSIQ